MSSRKIFISHSSKTTQSHDLLHQLGLELDGFPSYEVCFDQDGSISGGADWNRRIDLWMAECHVAIVLISEAVFDSDWVKKEAAVLCWRKQIQPEFLIIPVLIGDVTPESLEDDGFFKVIGLQSNQCIRNCADINELVNRVDQSIQAQPSCDVDWRENLVAKTVIELLCDDFKTATLINAVNHLNLEIPPWPLDEKLQLATTLTSYLFEDSLQSVDRFTSFLDYNLSKPEQNDVESILTHLRSIWVDPHAAEAFVKVTESARKASLNGSQVQRYTAHRYAERAWPLTNSYRVITIAETSYTFSKIYQDVVASFFTPDDNWMDDDMKKELLMDWKDTVIIVLELKKAEQVGQTRRMLDELKNKPEFSSFTFLIDVGENIVDNIPSDAPLLEPELILGTEKQQIKAHFFAQKKIKQLCEGAR